MIEHPTQGRPISRLLRWTALSSAVFCLGCEEQARLVADMPIHLEDHFEVANVIGSEAPTDPLAPVEWHFDGLQPDWQPLVYPQGGVEPVTMTHVGDALRL
ncbi:MAG TPA: hypothetical protein VNB06_16475, partial [Thermoanaerobaculia bacterium]|nr:hypothetical protein [Thermoanaerobaculia bacterium]